MQRGRAAAWAGAVTATIASAVVASGAIFGFLGFDGVQPTGAATRPARSPAAAPPPVIETETRYVDAPAPPPAASPPAGGAAAEPAAPEPAAPAAEPASAPAAAGSGGRPGGSAQREHEDDRKVGDEREKAKTDD